MCPVQSLTDPSGYPNDGDHLNSPNLRIMTQSSRLSMVACSSFLITQGCLHLIRRTSQIVTLRTYTFGVDSTSLSGQAMAQTYVSKSEAT